LASRAGQHSRALLAVIKQVNTNSYACILMFFANSERPFEPRPPAWQPRHSSPRRGGALRRALLLLLACLVVLPAQARLSALSGNLPPAASQRDLAQIRKDGELRVLVNQSRNSSGEVRGQTIGVEYRRLRAFEQYLNRNARGGRELRLRLIPRPKDQLLAALQRGEGDLVAPGELLDAHPGLGISASAPIRRNVPMVVVGNLRNRHYRKLEDMAGRSLVLPAGSFAAEALRPLNRRLAEVDRPPLAVEWADASLAVEDVLEMVQAGIYPWTAVELPIAERWLKVMPRLRIERHLV